MTKDENQRMSEPLASKNGFEWSYERITGFPGVTSGKKPPANARVIKR